jgi:hypothetical protein
MTSSPQWTRSTGSSLASSRPPAGCSRHRNRLDHANFFVIRQGRQLEDGHHAARKGKAPAGGQGGAGRNRKQAGSPPYLSSTESKKESLTNNLDVQRSVKGVASATRGSSGTPLSESVAGPMQARLGDDFLDVRVHTDARAGRAASALEARAFTVGTDVYFAPGEFRPSESDGERVLAHELTHVGSGSRSRASAFTSWERSHMQPMNSAHGRPAGVFLAWCRMISQACSTLT